MMYSEFLNLSGMTEGYITFREYTDEIEPIYNNSSCIDKREFMAEFKNVFKIIVYPAIEKEIKRIPSSVKEAYVFEGKKMDIEGRLDIVNREALPLHTVILN